MSSSHLLPVPRQQLQYSCLSPWQHFHCPWQAHNIQHFSIFHTLHILWHLSSDICHLTFLICRLTSVICHVLTFAACQLHAAALFLTFQYFWFHSIFWLRFPRSYSWHCDLEDLDQPLISQPVDFRQDHSGLWVNLRRSSKGWWSDESWDVNEDEPSWEEGPAKESGEERHWRRGTSDRDCCRYWGNTELEFVSSFSRKKSVQTWVPAVVPDIEVVGTFWDPLDRLLVGAPVDCVDRCRALDLQITRLWEQLVSHFQPEKFSYFSDSGCFLAGWHGGEGFQECNQSEFARQLMKSRTFMIPHFPSNPERLLMTPTPVRALRRWRGWHSKRRWKWQ